MKRIYLFLPVFFLLYALPAQVRTVSTRGGNVTAKPVAVQASFSKAAQKFIHVATPSNIQGHITTINSTATNDNPKAMVFVEQLYGIYNTQEVGVWYSGGKWKIFNQNRKPMPKGAKFNVLVLDPSAASRYAFTHQSTAANTQGHVTYLNHKLTNGKASKVLILSKKYGKYLTSPVGVWYTKGKWAIYNEDRSKMPVGTYFHILALEPGEVNTGISKHQGRAFQTRVSDVSKKKFRSGHVHYINDGFTNKQQAALVFSTPVWKGKYNVHPTGVWYSKPNWTVFNQNRQALPTGAAFNVLAIRPQNSNSNVVIADPQIKPVYNIKPESWKVIAVPSRNPSSSTGNSNSTEPEGPNLSLGKEISTLLGDPDLLPFIEKLNIFREIYEDKNPRAHAFYYLPATYALDWDREADVFALFFYYLSAGANGRGDVIVTAEFSPKLNPKDIQLAEVLLQKKLGKPVKLIPMPLRNTPNMDLKSSLSLFDVDPSSVSTNIPSDILKPIVVSWKMGKRVDDLLGFLLSRNQVAASMLFEPFGDDEKRIEVPVKMKINDSQTYGKLEFDNASRMLNGFQNPLDYPILLESLGLIRNKNGKKFVETVILNSYEVQPKSYFSDFSTQEKSQILEGDVIEEIWLNYSLNSECEDCGQAIKEKILGGTSSNLVKEIQVEILTPLSFSGAQSIKLMIKSTQADPKGETEEELPIISITEDFQTLKSGELFVPEDSQMSYEYQLILIMPDGQVAYSGWQSANEQFLVLGESSIKELFSDFIQEEVQMDDLESENPSPDEDD